MPKNAYKAKQLVVVTKNKIGMGAAVFGALRKAKVNVIANCCYEMGKDAHFWIIVEDVARAKSAVQKAGYKVKTLDVIVAELPNRAGALAKLLEIVAAAKVNVNYSYASAAGGKALVVLMTNADSKAIRTINK